MRCCYMEITALSDCSVELSQMVQFDAHAFLYLDRFLTDSEIEYLLTTEGIKELF